MKLYNCLDCGKQISEFELKPCKSIYGNRYKNGVPICDYCCKICYSVENLGGVGKCQYINKYINVDKVKNK